MGNKHGNQRSFVLIGGIGNEHEFGGELTKNKEIIRRLKELDYKVIPIDTYKANHSLKRRLRLIIMVLYNLLFRRKSNYVLSTAFNNAVPILKLIKCIPFRYKIIYWVIGGAFGKRVLNKEFDYSLLNLISSFLVEGKIMKEQLHEAGYKNVLYVPNFKRISVCYSLNNKNLITKFLFISRIMPEKGCDDILEVAKKLNKEGYEKGYKIDFYGGIEGSYKDSFCSEISKLDNCKYMGKIDLQVENNYKKLAEYDFMLFPTRWEGEGFPGVIIDAYKIGVPVIVTDWNFNSEFVIEGKSGILIPTNEIDSLKEAMKKCIEKEVDRMSMSNYMSSHAMDYDIQNIVTEELISKIMN